MNAPSTVDEFTVYAVPADGEGRCGVPARVALRRLMYTPQP